MIDEEQRFGVKQKELLRQIKLRVDVLSMSATPIPRTMQMSLAGLRDISVIETPPEGRRPVRTYVGPYDEELVTGAIQREVRREGQVFFLHNRIETLHDTAERLRAAVPEASFLEAHGQLEEGELESTMLSFLRGDADVLVATTIIESGLDVPAANTLVVERADHLGLAQAYQIRGRVGRSRERAYAYMLYPSEEGITQGGGRASRRPSPTTPSSAPGFRIAMRDLELRGAGDLLGAEQSGPRRRDRLRALRRDARHGRRRAPRRAARARGGAGRGARCASTPTSPPSSPPPTSPTRRPRSTSTAGSPRLGRPGELRALRDELRDRFGPPPEPVEALLAVQRARIELDREGARSRCRCGGRESSPSRSRWTPSGSARLRETDPRARSSPPATAPHPAGRRPTSPRRSGSQALDGLIAAVARRGPG